MLCFKKSVMPGLHLHTYTVHLHLCTDTRPYINAQVYTHIHTHMHTSTPVIVCTHTHIFTTRCGHMPHAHIYTDSSLESSCKLQWGIESLDVPQIQGQSPIFRKTGTFCGQIDAIDHEIFFKATIHWACTISQDFRYIQSFTPYKQAMRQILLFSSAFPQGKLRLRKLELSA